LGLKTADLALIYSSISNWDLVFSLEIYAMTTDPDLTNLFEEYKKLCQPVSPPDYPTKTSAANALDYLQFQFEETALSVFQEFDQKWLSGNNPNLPSLILRNVAFFYNPDNQSHRDAINFLESKITANAFGRAVDIWYGKDVWQPPADWVHPYNRLEATT
jgi:hypothetical protein